MADRRDEERRFRGERRDPEAERRIERLADRYRGSDERGYGGGDRDVRRYADLDRDRQARDSIAERHHAAHSHSDLAGLYDLDDLSELREHFRARPRSPRPMGRGPKNYQRSDDRIREDLCDRLMMSWMDAENVDVLVRDGEVTLQGTVKSRDEKRAIEALAESVLGVKDVHNTLKVQRGEQLPLAQERRPQDPEQTSAQQPGDTPLHS